MPEQLPQKHDGSSIICKALAKRNETDPLLKWMLTTDEKCMTYVIPLRKRSWSKNGEAPQTLPRTECRVSSGQRTHVY